MKDTPFKIKVNDKTERIAHGKNYAIYTARQLNNEGKRAWVTTIRNEVVWRPNDIIEEE